MAKTEIFTLGLDGSQYLTVATKLQKEIVSLTEKQKQLAQTTTGKTSKAFVQNASDLKTLKNSYNNALKANDDFNKQQTSTAELTRNVNNEFKKEINTINEANQQITRLNKVKKSLNANNKEEKKLLDDINKKIDRNTDFVKENSSSIEKQKINIGNYASALDGISPRLKGWVVQGQTLIKGLKAQRIALKGTTGGLKLFKIALISTGIGAIAIALGLLITYLTTTQKGVDSLTRVLTPLKIIFQSLLGVVQGMGEKMSNAFSNPKKAIIELWNSIKTNLVNRMSALGDIFKSLGKIISSGFTDGYTDFANATLQLTTGIEDVIGKVQNATKKTGTFFDEAIKRGGEIADLTIEISKAESKIALKRERNNNLIKEAELITKDRSKSQSEINKALKEAERLTKENLKDENDIIKLKIKKEELTNKSNDTNREELTKLNELEAQIEINKGKARGIELKFLGVKNKINSENIAANKKAASDKLVRDRKLVDEAIKNYGIELETFKLTNEVKLKEDEKLNESFVKSKIAYLKSIQIQEEGALKFKYAKGLIKENEFVLRKLEVEKTFQDKKAEILKSIADQEEADKIAKIEKDKEDRQIEFELRLEEISVNKETEYQQKLEIEQEQFDNDIAILDDRLLSKQLSQDQHDRAMEVLRKKHSQKIIKIEEQSAEASRKIEDLKQQRKLDALSATFNNVAELIGKETALGKAAAIASTTIDTYQSAVSAYKGMVSAIPGPVGIAAGSVAAALSIATGISTVKKIVSVKKPDIPKAEKGALFNLKGKRHSQGGEDIHVGGKLVGNMEDGEIFGVMSRKASKSFLQFNNEYTDGININNGMYRNGGAISTLDASSASSTITNGYDTELLAASISETVNDIKIVVPVLDVEDVINDNNTVIAQANI